MFKRNSGIFPFQSDQYQGLARIDHRFNDKNQLDFRYNITKLDETNQNIGALVGVSRGYVTNYFDSTGRALLTHATTCLQVSSQGGRSDSEASFW